MIFEKSSYQNLIDLQQICLKQNIPFASYRLPLETEITSMVQSHSFPEKITSLNDLNRRSGFIIAPFTESENHHTYFLKPEKVFLSNDIKSEYIQQLRQCSAFISEKKPDTKNIRTTTFDEYTGNVNLAIENMKAGEMHKVVLSKIRVENLKNDFSASEFYLNLCSKYPHAFVYMVQLPEVGCWIGATPEPLLVIENERVSTVSLAGTQVSTGAEINSYQWSEKEIEEQGIVTGFVENLLRSLEITTINKRGPENYQAANLIHLKTSFDFPENELKDRFSDFLKALHPTPSVGGLPKTEARNFILANEKHDRSYYTGFLGPINLNEKSTIFVNLRCLQLFDKQFVLYSGAGITTSSVAEREWEETDNKMMTMMNVINS